MTPAEDAPRTAPSHEAAIPAALAEENVRLRAGNAALEETIAVLLARVAELERRLNSSNSGKPPTGCTSPGGSRAVCASGPANRPAGRRRRDLAPGRRSERHHRSLPRDLCGLALTMATRCSVRQVFDLPEPLIVTEHRAYRCRCGRCGGETRAPFPEEVTAPVQYGPRLLAVYLLHYQLLPEDRLTEAMADLFGVRLVAATIARMS